MRHKITFVFVSLLILGCRGQNPGAIELIPSSSSGTSPSPDNSNNSGSTNTGQGTTAATIGLKTLQQTAIKTCADCHSTRSPKLITLDNWRKNERVVLSEINGKAMPPTHSGYKVLNACEIALIKRWFDLGAPEESDVRVDSISACAGK